MLKNLHPSSKKYLTSLLNEILFSRNCPLKWKEAIAVSILKPKLSSYRPISLTSVLGKLLEKILNQRLTWILEKNSLIDPHQYGFRSNRSTSHALYDLQSQTNLSFSQKSDLPIITIFFDMEKACDMIWRHFIFQTMEKHGLLGHLPKYIQGFGMSHVFAPGLHIYEFRNFKASPLLIPLMTSYSGKCAFGKMSNWHLTPDMEARELGKILSPPHIGPVIQKNSERSLATRTLKTRNKIFIFQLS